MSAPSLHFLCEQAFMMDRDTQKSSKAQSVSPMRSM